MLTSFRPITIALPELPDGWSLIAVNVLADGSLAMLATDAGVKNHYGQPYVPYENADGARARIWCFDGHNLVEGPAFPLETSFPCFDRFRDGRWVVAACRTEGEANARILTRDGVLLERIMLGDGIAHIAVARSGLIWVGWFDEGVFGNDDWQVAGEQYRPSSWGIGAFAADGAYQGRPSLPDAAGYIDDCYVLNVDQDTPWLCSYGDFAIIALHPDGARWWSGTTSGARGLAAAGNHVLLAGGYGAQADRLALLTLAGNGNGEEASKTGVWRMPLKAARVGPGDDAEVALRHPWQRPMLMTGRGDTVHLVQDGAWHRWRVGDAVAATQGRTGEGLRDI